MAKTKKLVDVRVSEIVKNETIKCYGILGISESEYVRNAVIEKNKRVLRKK